VALQDLHRKYFDRGFRVLCVLDEPVDEVRKVLPEAPGNLWVGVDTSQSTMKRYATEGALPIPRFYFVDDEGEVVAQQIPTDADVEKRLERVFIPALGRALAPALDAARALYDRGRPGAAWQAAGSLCESGDAEVAADAQFLREKVETYATWQKDRIERQAEKGDVAAAMADLVLFEFRFASLEFAAWATKRIADLEKDEKVRADRFAWKKVRAALQKEAKAGTSKSALQSVATAYRTVVKDHPDTKAAAIAKERMEALGAK
jgi:hypothetical protein